MDEQALQWLDAFLVHPFLPHACICVGLGSGLIVLEAVDVDIMAAALVERFAVVGVACVIVEATSEAEEES